MATANNFFLTETEVQKTNKSVFVNKTIENHSIYAFLTNYKTTPVNSQNKKISLNLQLVSRVSTKGKIKFCNADYTSATTYSQNELLNKPFIKTIHPEMPKTIMNHIIERLEKGQDAIAIVKHLDKNNNTYWLNMLYKPNMGNNHTIAFSVKAIPSSKNAIQKINKIYKTILSLENSNRDFAQKYFTGLLEMEYGNYDGLMIYAFQ